MKRPLVISVITDGFETPFGLELLATVHWVVTREEVRELADICRSVWNWGSHKKKFTSNHIEIASHRLESHDWFASA